MSRDTLPDRSGLDALRQGGMPRDHATADRPVPVVSPWWPLDYTLIPPAPPPPNDYGGSRWAGIGLVALIIIAIGLGLWMAVT